MKVQYIYIFQQNDTSQKTVESLRKSLKSHQTVLGKLQKKLLLVSAERDSQRQLLDNYEKDLTSKIRDKSSNFNEIIFFYSLPRSSKQQHRTRSKPYSH